MISPAAQSVAQQPPPQSQVDVSIVLTNWNGQELVRQAINSIYEYARDVSYEIIVVDDVSTDDSVRVIRENFPQVKLIRNSVNVGFAKSNNIGVAHASGKFVLLLNSDTLFIMNAIKVFLDFMKQHHEAGVCGGWLKNSDLTGQVSFGDYPSLQQAICDAFFLNDLFPQLRLPSNGVIPDVSITSPVEVDYVTGADIFIRKEIIDVIGLFDDRFEAYCEETDFCYRVQHELQRKIFFVPEAQIIHLGGKSYGKLGKRRIQIHYASYNKFLVKHHGYFYSFCTRLLYAWHYAVKLMTRTVRYLRSPNEDRKHHLLDAWYTVRYSLVPEERSTVS
jgi:GT2 family glycosyltransferase